jgi:hypothetical protein
MMFFVAGAAVADVQLAGCRYGVVQGSDQSSHILIVDVSPDSLTTTEDTQVSVFSTIQFYNQELSRTG